jgi:hypothetical protein
MTREMDLFKNGYINVVKYNERRCIKKCKICGNEYEGHPNSLYCNNKCKKEAKLTSSRKYNGKEKEKRLKIKMDMYEDNIIEGEEWRDCIGYEGLYWVSNLGRVKTKFRQGCKNILLKPNINSCGYGMVMLSNKDKERKKWLIHRLVGFAFIENPKPNEYTMIDHIDRNRQNNNKDNLRWVNAKINIHNSSNYKGGINNMKVECKECGDIVNYAYSLMRHYIRKHMEVIVEKGREEIEKEYYLPLLTTKNAKQSINYYIPSSSLGEISSH